MCLILFYFGLFIVCVLETIFFRVCVKWALVHYMKILYVLQINFFDIYFDKKKVLPSFAFTMKRVFLLVLLLQTIAAVQSPFPFVPLMCVHNIHVLFRCFASPHYLT